MSEWLPVLRELGGLGIAALMCWKVYVALDKNTRVLSRIEGILMDRGARKEVDT